MVCTCGVDLGEFDDVTSGSVDVEVVEGNVAVIPCPGMPSSRPAVLITEFTRNGAKITQSGRYTQLPSHLISSHLI